MLVLARKHNEAIRIGSLVHVKIIDIRRGCVRLGIEAPAEVQIEREELYQARIAALEAENASLKEKLNSAA